MCESSSLMKNSADANNMTGMVRMVLPQESRQDAQKGCQQGRSKRSGEAYASVR